MGVVPFQIDTSTPHPGVRIEDDVAVKHTCGGWVTMRAKKALSPGNHQWGIKILDQGDGADGSGLMVGILPKLSPSDVACLGSKYCSEVEGWCVSRAGQFYGTWKGDKIEYGTGCVIEFNVDTSRESVTITCGEKKVVGFINGIRDIELYPSFSMYYLNQRVMFV